MKTPRAFASLCALLVLPLASFAQESGSSSSTAGGGEVTADPVVLSGTVTPIPFPTDTVDAEYARRAGVAAVQQWVRDFLQRQPEKARSFAVLPLGRDIDGGYFTDQVRNAFAEQAAGTDYALYTRDDATWNALLSEIRRGDQFGDTMDPSTIQQFGRVQGVEGIIVGKVAGIYSGTANKGVGGGIVKIEGDGKVIQLRISLQAYEVETGRLLWGAERVGSAIMPMEELVIKRDWIIKGVLWGAVGLFAIFVLWILLGRLKSASRPR